MFEITPTVLFFFLIYAIKRTHARVLISLIHLFQVRSRSLNHLDTLDMRYGVQCASDATLKDSRSEPDCTRPLLAPPAPNVEPPSPTADAPISRRHVLSRSQVGNFLTFEISRVHFRPSTILNWDIVLLKVFVDAGRVNLIGFLLFPNELG